jgi:hypothetical protein
MLLPRIHAFEADPTGIDVERAEEKVRGIVFGLYFSEPVQIRPIRTSEKVFPLLDEAGEVAKRSAAGELFKSLVIGLTLIMPQFQLSVHRLWGLQ